MLCGCADHRLLFVAELLRFSSANHLLTLIPEEQQEHHRIKLTEQPAAMPVEPARRQTVGRARQHLVSKQPVQKKAIDIWDGWGDADGADADGAADADEGSDLDLDGLGL